MEMPSLKQFTPKELLQLTGKIIDELVARGIARTSNNPVSCYTEWLVSQRLDLTLSERSAKGFDAIDRAGVKYEIKARRITPVEQVTPTECDSRHRRRALQFLNRSRLRQRLRRETGSQDSPVCRGGEIEIREINK